jgi:hypothetical protein
MNDIDFSKYKRFFAFGCSFTDYSYPTWADIVSVEMPHAEYYNLGTSGSGNLLISNRIAQANCKFKFCETDLVMVMWSSAYREDRYVEDTWLSAGNIYTQAHAYDKNFVNNYCDPEGFMIRDMAILELTNGYLKGLPCNSYQFIISSLIAESGPRMNEAVNEQASFFMNKLRSIYPNTLSNIISPAVMETLTITQRKWVGMNNDIYIESHPDPAQYYNFLQHINLPLTDLSRAYVDDAMQKLSSVTHQKQIHELFADICNRDMVYPNGLF